MEKSLTIQTHPDNIKIDYIGNDIVKIHLHSDLALSVEFDNNVLFHSNGDFVISADGEIDLITNGSPICIDSINSKIHLNSREAKSIKDLPQSFEYKQKLIGEDLKLSNISKIKNLEEKELRKKVNFLEKKLEALIKILEIGGINERNSKSW